MEAQKFGNPTTTDICRWKFKLEDNETKEDGISRMPNNVLEFIVSLLTLKQGVTTSILSRRWRNIWRASMSCLDFNSSNMNVENNFFPKPDRVYIKERNKFIDRVNRVLQFRDASRLDALQISFPLMGESSSDIDRWLKSAAAQQITELKLDFNLSLLNWYHPAKEYKFPLEIFAQQLNSSLRYLSMNYCIFNFPPNFNAFHSLISLTLRNVALTQHRVADILSNCSSLEKFELLRCDFPDGSILQFSGPSLILKHIRCWACVRIKEIRVHDNSNILALDLGFMSMVSAVSIKNSPRLARLVLDWYSSDITTGDIPQLETLFLSSWRTESIRPRLCLNNLKQLFVRAVTINLLEMIYLVEACPMLQKLELDMGVAMRTEENLENIRTRPGGNLENVRTGHGRTANNLKQADIYGFEGYPTNIEFAKYLLRNAIMLEKMKISVKSKVYNKGKQKQQRMLSKEVQELLQKETRSSTELIIRVE